MEVSENNSEVAINRALEHGFGLETDVRDLNGNLVISHDPPVESSDLPDLRWLLERIGACGSRGRIALNVKADGLAGSISELIQVSGINVEQIYVFDMSVPDSISYLKTQIPVYSRLSEYEHKPPFLDNALGVWVDNFTGDFPQIQYAKELMSKGIRAAIVSPELHRRDHQALWQAILDSGIHHNPLFELCTDYPAEAARQFCDP
jgi:hypothetical protein